LPIHSIGFFIFRTELPAMEPSNIYITPSREVRLFLPNQKPRNIGWLSEDGYTFHTQRNPEKHYHRQSESVGFNYELLRDGSFHWVVVHLPYGKELVTTRNHILEKGIFLHFKQRGFEKQRFLPLTEFGIEKAQATESRQDKRRFEHTQKNLFGEAA
jgi:hypothetical protein